MEYKNYRAFRFVTMNRCENLELLLPGGGN